MRDTPVGYAPQVGTTPQYTTIYYNQREAMQPATFGFGNLSSKWAHNWQDYVTDDPAVTGYYVTHVYGGGGGHVYPVGYASGGDGNGYFYTEPKGDPRLVRTP